SNTTYQIQYINSSGGVIKWDIDLPITKDSTVYFWRIRLDTLYENKKRWYESTFIYIKDAPTGWNQSTFTQFKDNEFQFLNYDNTAKELTYVETKDEFLVQTEGPSGPINGNDVYFFMNKARMSYMSYCQINKSERKDIICIAIIDRDSLQPWTNPPGKIYGSISCMTGKEERWFAYVAGDVSYRDSAANLINNLAPDSSWILIFSWNNNYASQWTNDALNSAIKSLGVKGFDLIEAQDDYPFIILGKKGGALGTAIELYPDTNDLIGNPPSGQILTLDTSITNDWSHGYITSEMIGPAKSWGSLHWKYKLIDVSDSIYIDIIGIDNSGKQTTLISELDSTTMFLNSIDASSYPYIKLRVYLQDKSLRSPPELKMLRVLYEPVTELALNPSISYSFYNDTIQEGDNIKFEVAIENISNVDSDSLLIEYSIIDQNNKEFPIPYERQSAVIAGDTILSSISFSSFGYSGNNKLLIDVNPDNDQPEQFHFNNVGTIPFYVTGDNTKPALDVTFDGIHILNGDIVSPTPEIVIKLTDDNKFIALDDTSDFYVEIKNPNENFKRLNFYNGSEETMKFIPAKNDGDNIALIELNPQFTEDGIYEMRVAGNDKAGNRAGKNAYSVSFEVINKSTITEVINYPNPFSSSTRFVFTLTGSSVPTEFRIQILTVSGKVVREIEQNELGSINIGRNITQFAWDGTDKFGDQLANGIYLYRVFTTINGQNIEKNSTDADKFFFKGFGKMYLLR
ncbi:MAG: hypothetical protein JKY33_05560, partial [Bacteroidia bacterium]|nr:hypothetical protein [Bacteroidia bacterium]